MASNISLLSVVAAGLPIIEVCWDYPRSSVLCATFNLDEVIVRGGRLRWPDIPYKPPLISLTSCSYAYHMIMQIGTSPLILARAPAFAAHCVALIFMNLHFLIFLLPVGVMMTFPFTEGPL